MRPLIPSKRSSLGSARAGRTGGLDLVESWQNGVRSRLARQAALAGPEPSVSLHVDFGFVLLAAALGLAQGPLGALRSLVYLLSILLVHEAARAALTRGMGRSSRVSISVGGGQTEISEPELQGVAAVGFALVGSLANLLCALALHAASWHLHTPAWGIALRNLGTAHAIWGIAQALPLIPFRAGTELARRLPPSLRSGHAIASGGLAIGAVFAIFSLPQSPLLLLALLFVLVSSLRAAREAFREEFDHQNQIASKLDEARSALAANNPRWATECARAGLELARSNDLRQKLWSTLAWAGIGDSNPFAAHAALQQLPQACIDVHLLASYLFCCNRSRESQELLLEARQLGQRCPETSKLLIEVLFGQGDRAGALAVIAADAAILSEQDRRAALLALGAPSELQP
jgi:hypothetical protein